MDKIDIWREFDLSMGMFQILCGKFIGEGQSRIVYDCAILPGYVVKIEKEADTWHNQKEYLFYQSVYYQSEVTKWLCPIKWVSENGRIMIQKKASPITSKNRKNLPKRVPAFLSDIKEANYGFIGEQLVCWDYSSSLDLSSSYALGKQTKKFKSHLGEF